MTMLRKIALVYKSTSAKVQFPNTFFSIHKHDCVYIQVFLFARYPLICLVITIQLPIVKEENFSSVKYLCLF